MASNESSHTQSINPLPTDILSSIEPTESHTPAPPSSPTIVLITSNSSQSISSISSLKKNSTAYNHSSLPYVSIRNKKEVKEISGHLRRRLCVRARFFARLTLVSDLMSFLAILGIILMIIENELTFNRVDNQDTKASWFIKLIITITTVILVILIFYYHHLDMALYAYRNLLEDWRVQLTPAEILVIAVEILICVIHPMPRAYPQTDPEKINSTSLNPYPLSYTAVDVGLGLPMFLRLYLLGRSLLIHSTLVRNVTLRSFGYLNHVSINVFFLIKAYLELWPTRCMLICCTIIFFIGSWSLRACDYAPTGEHLSLSDAMWLFIVTFTTIGYGDLYPSTYCARSVAAIIGLIGLLAAALLIAILTQKLHLTREEKYVHTFVLNAKLGRKCKHQAADVIKFGIKVWYLKRKNKSTSFSYFQTQQKFFQSIQTFQEIKQKQRHLTDTCAHLTELINTQRKTRVQVKETTNEVMNIKIEVKQMEKKLNNIKHSIDTLQKTLNVVLDKITK